MIQYFKHVLFSLRFSMIFILVGLFVITTILILSIRWIIFSNELTYTSLTLMQSVSNQVSKELTSGLRPVEVGGQFSAHLLESGVLLNTQTQLVPYTYYLVKTIPLVQGVYWGDEQGNFIHSKKERDGSITSDIVSRSQTAVVDTTLSRDLAGHIINTTISTQNITYDPRSRPWYLEAKKYKKSTWTDIYKFYTGPRMGISNGSPVFAKDGKLLGVFGLDVTLDYLTDFMTKQRVSQHGYSFIITEKGNLIAFPHREPFIKALTVPNHLINVHFISLPLIEKSIDWYTKTGQYEFNMLNGGKTYLVTYTAIPEFTSQGWLIGVITPRSDFTSALEKANWITLFISFITLVICMWIVSIIITRVVKPINRLVKETNKIKHFELDDELHIQSRIKEVIELSDAMSSLKSGLKQFQKYVPKQLVQQLIESGEDSRVGGIRKQVVVFFSDIENFTTVAEKMDPNELMEQICQYFDELSHIIILQKGTIDKYIGDSIMAFWGAPLMVENPCDYAAKAALLCQKKIEELNQAWTKQGKPCFITRMGIHKGEAIVGNVGSSERLNYTALGDTINLTSRLEKINKIYKTNIIVSDSVYEEIKDRFTLRMIDTVVLTGRTTAIDIYELLAEKISTP